MSQTTSTPPASAPQRKLPRESLFTDSAPFWKGTRERRLMLQFCPRTQRFQHFPRPVSLYTGSRELQWKEVSGQGFIYAHTVLRTPGLGADGRLPCVLALVELDEGVRILANLPGSQPGELKTGDRVHLVWDALEGDARYPAFAAS